MIENLLVAAFIIIMAITLAIAGVSYILWWEQKYAKRQSGDRWEQHDAKECEIGGEEANR